MKRFILLVLFCCVSLASAVPQPGVSLDAKDWTFRAVEMPRHPTNLTGMRGWFFEFPTTVGSIHYVTTKYATALTDQPALTVTVETRATSGAPAYMYNTDNNPCPTPANTRMYFEHAHLDLSAEFERWWANPDHYVLADQTVTTMTVPLTPDRWSSVFGKFGNADANAMAGFAEALAHPGRVGLTFGGGCFFGHGVWVENGTARFVLTNYAVQ